MNIGFDFDAGRLTSQLHAKLRRITPTRINRRKLFTTTLLLSASLLSSFADTERVDVGYLRYTVDTEAMTAEVYGPVSSSQVITDLVIPDYIDYNGGQVPVTSIRSSAFRDNRYLSGSLTIGNSVETIGNSAFYYCSGFTGSLTIGESVQTIGENAFYNCDFTSSLTIPNSVKTIGNGAFYLCSGFNGSLTIGISVETIGDEAFYNCRNFTGSLTIPNSVQTIGEEAFYGCSRFNGSLTIGNSVQTIGKKAFGSCSSLTESLSIPNSVQKIGDYAFSGCLGFTGSLIIPNSVETIERGAFSFCSGLDGSLTIPNTVQSIGEDAFAHCSRLTGELVIPESVREIGRSCFNGCNFTSLLIMSQEVEIFSMAFYCSGFQSITCQAITPPPTSYFSSEFYVFTLSTYSSPLYVPAQSVEAYKTAPEWEKFANIKPISIEPTFLTLNKTQLELRLGKSEKLIATVLPEDVADPTVTWKSDNPEIAEVADDGTVTGVSLGVTTITATCGDVSATCKVTVIEEEKEGEEEEPSPGIPDTTVEKASTPLQLLRKGDGTSCTLVVMMDLSDSQLAAQGYRFVFGYTSGGSAEPSVLDSTTQRYVHVDAETFNNSLNDFWVFAYYADADGTQHISSRRHLDGSIDDDFDATRLMGLSSAAPSDEIMGIYNLSGQYVGKDTERLKEGIYVVKTLNGSYKLRK